MARIRVPCRDELLSTGGRGTQDRTPEPGVGGADRPWLETTFALAYPGGERFWLEDACPVRDDRDAVFGVEVLIQEVQLDFERLYDRGLTKSSVEGLVAVDLEGNVSNINGRMCQMAGWRPLRDRRDALPRLIHRCRPGAPASCGRSRKGSSPTTPCPSPPGLDP